MEWGVHTSYDAFEEGLRCADGYQHEVQVILPLWPLFHQVDAKATERYLARFWHWHTDQTTGVVDRHPTRGKGLDFAMAAGEVVLVCAFLHAKHPDGLWLDRARQVARAHCEQLSRAKGPTALLLPKGGCGEWDRPGADLHDQAGLSVFIEEITANCPPNAELVEIGAHINDAAFADKALEIFDRWRAEGIVAG